MRTWILALKNSSFHVLTLFWVWIIARQWIVFMDNIWYQETSAIVITTITVIAIIEFLLPIKVVYRVLLECIAIIYIIHRELVAYWVYIPSGTLANRLQELAVNLYPYIWFALGAGVLFVMSTKVVNNKPRILLFVSLNIIAFAILDSFTEYLLWKQVAWIAFASLGWLASDHLRLFQHRYPKGWKQLRKAPFKFILNIVVLFSILFTVGVNMPQVPPSITDPYTAWRNMSGDTVTDASADENKKKGDKKSASGYSRNDNSLGGSFDFDYSPVMTVYSTQRSYWRGETRKVYSGTGWADKQPGRGAYDDVSAGQKLPNEADRPEGQTLELEQTVTMMNDQNYPVLFGAYSISKIDEIDGEQDASHLRWNSAQSEVHWNGESRKGHFPKTYKLTSQVPIISEDEIRGKTYSELYGNQVDDSYLQVPADFPERVRKLAEEITASASTPYEKVGLLQNYLLTHYKYTNEPDMSRKVSKDFVDSFLFEIQEGYCDYYSTALVMMSRSLNIPARWVKGYAPGTQQGNADDMMLRQGQERVDSGIYTVTNADAHSWAEVYFGPYGWVPVEATPGFNMPLLTHAADSQPVSEPEKKPEEVNDTEQEKAAVQTAEGQSSWMKPVGIAAAVVVVLWVIYMLWHLRLQLCFLAVQVRTGMALTPDQKVVVMTQRWVRQLKRRGLARSEDETLRESVLRWQQDRPELIHLLTPLLVLFEKARYSPESVTDAEWRTVVARTKDLKSAMK